MPNEIIVNPTTLKMAAGIEKTLQVGGQITLEGIPYGFNVSNFNPNPNFVLNDINHTILRVTTGTAPIPYETSIRIPARQPFTFYAEAVNAFSSNYDCSWGIKDNLNRVSYVTCFNYPPEPALKRNVVLNNVVAETAVPILWGAGFKWESDGKTVTLFYAYAGQFHFIYSFPITSDVTDFRLWGTNLYLNNYIKNVYYGVSTQTIPLIGPDLTYNVLPTTNTEYRVGTANDFYIKSLVNQVGSIEVSHPSVPQNIVVPFEATSLYLRPVGCGVVGEGGEGGEGGESEDPFTYWWYELGW